jgi:hypothetical protein
LFLKDPYSHRTNNLFGRIFNDIKAGIPPCSKPEVLNGQQEILWEIIASCWTPKPEDRITAGEILLRLQQVGWKQVPPNVIQDTRKDFVRHIHGTLDYPSFVYKPLKLLNDLAFVMASEFAPHQLEAGRTVFKLIAKQPKPGMVDFPFNLVPSELMEAQGAYGWCLIGKCGIRRAEQISGRPYIRNEDFVPRRPLNRIRVHILETHFNTKQCKIWYAIMNPVHLTTFTHSMQHPEQILLLGSRVCAPCNPTYPYPY